MTAPNPRTPRAAPPNAETTDARRRILEAALDLFHAHGVGATGLSRILDASGTGKGQFYHYFASKDELVLEVMRHFRGKLASGEIPLIGHLASWEDLERWFGFFLEAQRQTGCTRSCPIGTMAGELGEEQGELRAEACAILEGARAVLADFFARMQTAGALASAADSAALADFCYAIMQGGMLLAKIERRLQPFENAVAHALAHVRSLRVDAER